MTRKSITAGAYVAAAVLSLATAPAALAQAAPAATPAPTVASTEEEVVVLSPFVVSAAEDKGYRASSTLAGSRIRTDLKDVGSAISVVTEEFLRDTGSKKAEDLLVYTTNTEVSGQGGSFLGQGDGGVIDSTARYTSPVANTRVRGLAEADNTRDYFLSDIPWDAYVVGRVDLQRGPNAILFGIGSPAGIVNSTLDQAAFADANKVEAQVGSFGSNRISGNFNKVLLKDELAIRLALLRDDTRFQQDPAFSRDKRAFAALRWDPKFLATDSARTSFRINFEQGKVRSNQPRQTPPLDAITQWWTTGAHRFNQQLYNGAAPTGVSNSSTADNWATPGEGANYNGSPNFVWDMNAPGNRVYDSTVVTFSPDGTQTGAFVAQPLPSPVRGTNIPFARVAGIATYDVFARNINAPYSGIYKARSLTDPSIFDFYNNLLDGGNKREWNNFHAYNASLSQTFLNNRLGFEFAYDQEHANWGRSNSLSNDSSSITVDVMATLTDGSVNPNAGRAMIIGGGGASGGYDTVRTRKSWRFTSFGEFDFRDVLDKKSNAADILGSHRFTVMSSSQEVRRLYRRWTNNFSADSYFPASNVAVGQATRDVLTYAYIDDRNLTTVSSPAGLDLAPVSYLAIPRSTTIRTFDNVQNTWVDTQLDVVNADLMSRDSRPYTGAAKDRKVVDSLAAVWQGYMFDNCLVPMIGYRKDTESSFDAGSPQATLGVFNLADPNWRIPDTRNDEREEIVVDGVRQTYVRSVNSESGQSMTYSLVAHTPKALNKRLPFGMKASVFYSQSENFQPNSSRKDVIGNSVASPTGKTKDYGFTLSALDDKIVFKINWYKTQMWNATLSEQNLGGSYLLGAGEAWGQAAAIGTRDGTGRFANQNFGTSSSGGILRWQPAGNGTIGAQAGGLGDYSQAEIDAQYAIQQASLAAWFANPIPVSMQNAWGMPNYSSDVYGSWAQANVAVTGDTVSKGVEYELTARPLPGLDISLNASKNNATRLNLASSYVSWVESRWAFYNTAAGDMRLWGSGNWALGNNSGGTVKSKFNNEFMSNYLTALALNGAEVAELRPWRANLVVNYSFQKDGLLKGVNVGAGYRWQGKQTIGYPVVNPDAVGMDPASPTGYYHQTNSDLSLSDEYVDVAHPFKGPCEDAIDLWIGYERKLTDKLLWRVQLNVRNAFGTKDLIPVTWNPDNTPGTYRIPEPRTWSLTNTFTF